MSDSVYVGVSGSEIEIGDCRDSIQQITVPAGSELWFNRATKGYEARQAHFNKFVDGGHDWMLLLDHDMIYARDTLLRLMSHDVDYVSGYYLQRRFRPLVPVWFHPFTGAFPLQPFIERPEPGRLHPLGASGWGCILIHRRVVEGTRENVLNGSWDVLEDDMAVYPYNLSVIMSALDAGDIAAVRREFQPLRGQFDRQPMGSDLRYPILASMAGFQLMGDAGVCPGHVTHYPVEATDYGAQSADTYAGLMREAAAATERGREKWRNYMDGIGAWKK